MRSVARVISWIVLVLLWSRPAGAQILNTLGGWADTTGGWTGRLGVDLDLSGGNSDVRSYGGAARAQWQDDRFRLRGLGSFRVEDAAGERVKEERLFHLRGAFRVSPLVVPFAFVQAQRNPFVRLRRRWLLGAGVEFVFLRPPPWTLGVGVSPMVEFESLNDPGLGEEATTRGRLSTFVRLAGEVGDHSRWNLIGFFQPRLSDPADFRSSLSSSVETTVIGPLGFLLLGAWEHDDAPPAGVRRDDWSLRLGLTLGL